MIKIVIICTSVCFVVVNGGVGNGCGLLCPSVAISVGLLMGIMPLNFVSLVGAVVLDAEHHLVE